MSMEPYEAYFREINGRNKKLSRFLSHICFGVLDNFFYIIISVIFVNAHSLLVSDIHSAP